MRILLARNSGFCFGVRRAVDMAGKLAAAGGPVCTYGNIIHNETVVAELKEKGITPVRTVSEAPAGATLVIRAHGAPREVFSEAAAMGLNVADATCPFVSRIHCIAAEAGAAGLTVAVAGSAAHPEVVGILGHTDGPKAVFETPQDVEKLPASARVCLVSQTTVIPADYARIAEAARARFCEVTVHHTICDTTALRQAEAVMIAQRADRVLVLGSLTSANTRRLTELCRLWCGKAETIDDVGKITLDKFHGDDIIGIVAGASTPDRMIREGIQVMEELEKTTIETIEAAAPEQEVVARQPEVTQPTAEAPETEEAVAPEAEAPTAEAAAEEAPAAEAAPEAEAPAAEAKAEEAPVEEKSEFERAFEQTLTRIRNGQIIKGTVLSVVDGEVFVNIGYKSDGFIPKNEFSSNSELVPEELVKEGDEIEVEVLKVNDGEGNVLLSRKNVEGKKLWDELMEEAEIENKIFDAVGKEVVKGGVIADIKGIRAFVPASQVSTKYIENLSEYVGKPMRVKVLEVDKSRKRIVASQKQVMLAEAAAAKRTKWEALVVGSKVQGIVRRITDFGAFVDIGGIDGLVHVTDAAWGRVKHPSDVFSIGQEIEVLILNVDVEKERVSLGYKQLQPKPWTLADQKYPVGSVVEGKVVRIVPFGAFVALESTIDGLIHISQVATHRVAKVEDELKVGDVVRCKVLEVDPQAKRISLSRKEAILEENPEIAQQLADEKAERDRQYQERRDQQQQQQQQRRERRSDSAPAERSSSDYNRDRGNSDRRRRNSEDGEYELPPVQSAGTSLADLLKGFKTDDE